jgi:hypothetical protein
LLWLYDSLIRHDPVQQVDVAFVMAGRMERKPYGLDLFRAGMTPRLILSVGRFEVSKMKRLELPGSEELIRLRDGLAPDERHFFVDMNTSNLRTRKVKLSKWNTYGEVLALHEYLNGENVGRLMVVSTDIHLRRVAWTFSKVFRDRPLQLIYCPVPTTRSALRKDRWWTREQDRRYVLQEMIKLIGYRIILAMPAGAARWLMQLKTERQTT